MRLPLLARFSRSTRPSISMEPLRFGVATADHQCEAYDPQREDIRDVWERRRGLVRGVATSHSLPIPNLGRQFQNGETHA